MSKRDTIEALTTALLDAQRRDAAPGSVIPSPTRTATPDVAESKCPECLRWAWSEAVAARDTARGALAQTISERDAALREVEQLRKSPAEAEPPPVNTQARYLAKELRATEAEVARLTAELAAARATPPAAPEAVLSRDEAAELFDLIDAGLGNAVTAALGKLLAAVGAEVPPAVRRAMEPHPARRRRPSSRSREAPPG